jgi:hypothetical protein
MITINELFTLYDKTYFHHENTKFRKLEICLFFFRVFVVSCFRDTYFIVLVYLRDTTLLEIV